MIGDIQSLWDAASRDKDAQEVGIGGFTATAIVSVERSTEDETPDHHIETGEAVHDHTIKGPLRMTIEGHVGDVHLRPAPVDIAWRRLDREVGAINQYLPERTADQVARLGDLAATVADSARGIERAVEQGQSLAGFFGDQDPEKPLGEQFLDLMEAIREADVLIPLDFPYRRYERMKIQTMAIRRDAESRALSYELGFKQLDFSETRALAIEEVFPNATDGTRGELGGPRNKGSQPGEEVPRSFAFELIGG